MTGYIARRILLMFPTLLGILFVSFVVVQFAPGGPVERVLAQLCFDKPAPERFALMVWNFSRFDFGKSYFRDVSVIQLIKEKLPVSMSLGIWMMLLTYLISIPLGIRKAVQDGSKFDTWTSAV